MVRSLRFSQDCERVRFLRCSHVKRVLTDIGGVLACGASLPVVIDAMSFTFRF